MPPLLPAAAVERGEDEGAVGQGGQRLRALVVAGIDATPACSVQVAPLSFDTVDRGGARRSPGSRPWPAAIRRRTTCRPASAAAPAAVRRRRSLVPGCRAGSSPCARRSRRGGRRTACRPARPGSRSRAGCPSRRRVRVSRQSAWPVACVKSAVPPVRSPGTPPTGVQSSLPAVAVFSVYFVQAASAFPSTFVQSANSAYARPSIVSSCGTDKVPVLTWCQCSPPSSVAHSSGPNAQP